MTPRIPRRAYVYGALGGAALALLARSRHRPTSGVYTLPSFATRDRATRTTVDPDGFVRADPRTLASQARSDVETNTMARFIASEFGSGTPLEKAAIAWAIKNKARQRGWSILRMATTVCWKENGQARCADTGLYGKQFMGGAVVGGAARPRANRYAATPKDPTRADLHIATMVLSGAWPDPTGGATMFLDPSAFGLQAGTRAGGAEAKIREWEADGHRVVSVPGVRREKLVLLSGIDGATRDRRARRRGDTPRGRM